MLSIQCNSANPRHHIFQKLILTSLKTFYTTFPKFNLARLISPKQLKNSQTIGTNTFMITRIITNIKFYTSPIYWKTVTSTSRVINYQDTFLNTSVESFNFRNFHPASAALFLDNDSFYHLSIPLLSILISSKQQLKPKIQHILYYSGDTSTKYLIIMTESSKVILLASSFDQSIYFHMICLLPTY